jgi:hypothetical protein
MIESHAGVGSNGVFLIKKALPVKKIGAYGMPSGQDGSFGPLEI